MLSRRHLLTGAASVVLTPCVASAAAAAAAAETIAAERAAAIRDGKQLLVVFYASWCGWCRFMDLLLADRQAGAVLNRHFRVVHLRVLERRAEMRAQELSGADETFAQLQTTPGQGLPYLVVLNAEGDVVTSTTSEINGENIGFPVDPHELAWFEQMMRRGAPGITAQELATLRQACVRLAPR